MHCVGIVVIRDGRRDSATQHRKILQAFFCPSLFLEIGLQLANKTPLTMLLMIHTINEIVYLQ